MSYGNSISVNASFTDTVQRVRDELEAEGFGILTEIDITGTLREKLGEQMENYLVLGACNPPLAHKALTADRSIGLLLPCNVVVRDGGTGTIVEALDPQVMVGLSGNPDLTSVADDAAGRLQRVLSRLAR
jgi:uncharacterized protein (DUF302 family)